MLEFKGNSLLDFSCKLSKMHKAALPNAVRFSLNDAAKDVKFNTLQKHAKSEFDVRKPTFFKAFSGYKVAEGYDIGKMKSTVGMIKGNPKNPKSKASTQIGEQQSAGNIPNKSYVRAIEQTNNKGLLKPSYSKLVNIKPIVSDSDFFEKAVQSRKEKKPLLVRKNNKGVLVKVRKISKKTATPITTEPIANYQKNRTVKLKTKHPFLNNASIESGKKLNKFYVKNAKKQIERFAK